LVSLEITRNKEQTNKQITKKEEEEDKMDVDASSSSSSSTAPAAGTNGVSERKWYAGSSDLYYRRDFMEILPAMENGLGLNTLLLILLQSINTSNVIHLFFQPLFFHLFTSSSLSAYTCLTSPHRYE